MIMQIQELQDRLTRLEVLMEENTKATNEVLEWVTNAKIGARTVARLFNWLGRSAILIGKLALAVLSVIAIYKFFHFGYNVTEQSPAAADILAHKK